MSDPRIKLQIQPGGKWRAWVESDHRDYFCDDPQEAAWRLATLLGWIVILPSPHMR